MNKTIGLILCCVVSILVSAQPVVKGYAWKEQSARGAKPAAVAGEAGNAAARPAIGSGNLFVFIEFKPGQNILPYRIWIDGKPYRLIYELQHPGPVIRQTAAVGGSGYDNDTLVATTSNQVMEITAESPLTKLTIPTTDAAKANAVTGTIVVEYYWRARRYAYTFPEIKMLRAVRLQ